MKRNSICISILLLLISFAHAQTLKKEFPSEQQIDVVENLGDFIPLDTKFIDESGNEVELSTFFIFSSVPVRKCQSSLIFSNPNPLI